MGYRSSVALAIDKGIYLKYEMLLNELPKILKTSKRLESSDAYFWFFEGWKWYDGYEDIDSVNNFMTKLDDEAEDNKEIIKVRDVTEGYGFIRIGEETEDIEERGQPWDYSLYVHRNIDTMFGMLDGLEETN